MKNVGVILVISILCNVILTTMIFMQRKTIKSLKPKYNIHRYNLTTRRTNMNRAFRVGKKMMTQVDALDGIQFEKLCCEILYMQGYKDIFTTRTTGDYGVDILCKKNGQRLAIQCKCYSSSIGIDAVQQAYSGCAYYQCHIPVVMTNQYFTDAAQELARKLGVVLWSRYHMMDVLENLKKRI